MSQMFKIDLTSETSTQKFAEVLAKHVDVGVLYLIGDLGAGKTTFTRYFLQARGHQGAVKSPTYTIVEPYDIAGQSIFHFDLYRLNDPYELELIGIRDYLDTPQALFLFEWPSKGENEIPQADIIIELIKHESDESLRTLMITSQKTDLIERLREDMYG